MSSTKPALVLGSLLVLSMVGLEPVSAAVADSPADEGQGPAPALKFREDFGFTTDLAVIDTLERDPRSNRDYGVPLTEAERTEMSRRERISEGMPPLEEYLAQRPTSNGGMYLDNKAGGVLVVQIVGALPAEDQQAIGRMAPEGAQVVYRNVSTTLKALEDAYDRANRLMPTLIKAGVELYEVSIDVKANSLEFGLSRMDPTWINRIREEMAFDALSFTVTSQGAPATCSMNNCLASGNPLLRGALRIWKTDGALIYWCTSGFLVRTKQNPANIVQLTAGHCFNGVAGSVKHGEPAGTYDVLGSNLADAYWSGSNTDARIYDVINSRKSNYIYLVVNITNEGSHGVGSPVCMKGQATGGSSCGEILSSSVSRTYPDGTIFIQQVKASFNINIGDSGGPVYHGGGSTFYAHGLVTYRDGANVSVYSRLDYIRANLNVDLCTNLSCS